MARFDDLTHEDALATVLGVPGITDEGKAEIAKRFSLPIGASMTIPGGSHPTITVGERARGARTDAPAVLWVEIEEPEAVEEVPRKPLATRK